LRAEVRRHGEVVILRFRREEHRPPRKPSAKRFFRGVKAALAPCQEPEITADQLEDLILKTFGSDYQYHILISDEKFRMITREKVAELLSKDDTDKLPYIDTYGDCDDFSDVLLGSLTKATWSQGFAFANFWWYCSQFGHAQNLFVDESPKIWIIEPQSDEIMSWEDIKAKYPDARAFLVKF
jgi:hypothetical protein